MVTFLLSGIGALLLAAILTKCFGWKGALAAGMSSFAGGLLYWAREFNYFQSPNDGSVITYTVLFGVPTAVGMGVFALLGIGIGLALRAEWKGENPNDKSSEREV
ncbi:MAG: hypothetical protein JWQ07_1414 [Ramlibacter sp.]|nr:hypothetical protein [Ramlibacter sp.]